MPTEMERRYKLMSKSGVRNLDFAKKYRITGTPTLVFADGTRVPGAINTQQIEELLNQR